MKLKGAKLYKIEMDELVLAAFVKAGLGREVWTEYRFMAPTRAWRFDYAQLELKIAVEIEGGIFTQGRHTRGAGYERDLEKYNTAAVLGWRVIRITPEQVRCGELVGWMQKCAKPCGTGALIGGRSTVAATCN